MALHVGERLGPYEILGPIGAGGMGEVYRARDWRLGRVVAIKVLPADRMADENRRRRFVQEARAASALNHPNIVTIHEIESANGIDFIVMEFLEGETLDAVIPRQGMKLGDVLRIAIPIADAVARAHTAGIVHRDLKPANVMVGSDGVVKVLDFGLAKLVPFQAGNPGHATVSDGGDAGPLSRPGAVTGTAAYMSPEQATGKEVDSRSDVFSLGAMLYEMMTGQKAFAGNSTTETLAAVVRDQPRALSEVVPNVPRELERLIQRCLRKGADRRFQHMLDVKIELLEIKEDSESGSAVAPTSLPIRRRWLAAGIVTTVGLAAGGWLLWRAPGSESPAPSLVPLTSTPGRETGATFSPDGTQIAFAWNGEKGDKWDIYVKMIDSAEAHRLTTDDSADEYPSWSPDGRQIAFLRAPRHHESGTIRLISPLGGSDRKLSDEPVGWGRLSWSPDGRWLATAATNPDQTATPDERGVRLIAVSTGETRWLTSPNAPTYHADAAFSPDGRRLAYAACQTFAACHVELVDLDRGSPPVGPARRLTRNTFWMGGLAWARDGRSVVYCDRATGRLSRVGVAGDQRPERIELAGFETFWPTISVSRNRLVFEHLLLDQHIYRVEAGRPSEAAAASSMRDWKPQFSPDGHRFAFASGRGGEGEEIWVAAADGSSPVQLTHGPGRWQGSPCWSPDGRRIAFDSAGEDGHWDIWTVDAEGGSPRRVTSGPADHNLPSWSRDNRFIYFTSNRAGAPYIWRVPATGGAEEQVTRTGGSVAQEAADGKLLYHVPVGDSEPLMALSLASGSERTVIDCVPGFFAVGAAGVYHLGCQRDHDQLRLLDPTTGQDRGVGTLEHAAFEFTVSPDGKTVLYTKDVSRGSDLMMIENFR